MLESMIPIICVARRKSRYLKQSRFPILPILLAPIKIRKTFEILQPGQIEMA